MMFEAHATPAVSLTGAISAIDAVIAGCANDRPQREALAAAISYLQRMEWRTMESAPKSAVVNGCVRPIYLLGICPDEGTGDDDSYLCVIWWEPLMNWGAGQWHGEACDLPMRPILWCRLPVLPLHIRQKQQRSEISA